MEHDKTIQLNSIDPGRVLPLDIFDDHGVLLLRAGTRVTHRFLAQLRQRGIDHVKTEYSDPDGSAPNFEPVFDVTKFHSEASRRLDGALEPPSNGFPQTTRRPATSRLDLKNLREEQACGLEQVQMAQAALADLADDLMAGASPACAEAARDIVAPFCEMCQRDVSLGALILDLQSSPGEYLYQHGLNVAVTAMTIAQRLGYNREETIELGIAGLFQDLGMLDVPEEIRFAQRELTPEEWYEVQRHPILTVDRLERVQKLPTVGLVVAYQAHERCDGSGYPRHRSQMFIRPMAKLIAAADTYAAIVCNRPYRPAKLPYHGTNAVLQSAATGALDRTIARAMLDQFSLFPVGSYVSLSNGVNAKVLRANGEYHKSPVVIPLNDDGSESDEELDLSLYMRITVVGVHAPADATQGKPSDS